MEMSPDSQWYYARGGQQLGPVSTAALRDLLRGGQLTAGDLVWAEGMPAWQQVKNISALSAPVVPDIASPPAVYPPPPIPAYAVRPDPLHYGGAPIPYYPTGQSYNGLAIAGFVLALTMPLIGLIVSLIALNSMKNSGNFEGHGLAKAGVIIPLVEIGVILLFACFWFTLFASLLGMSGHG
jgi:hypothetical protein